MNYYNEFDKYAAQWLRNLIAAGHIAPGEVDERSISDVRPSDLVGYTQCHFFAGIGGWSLALRLAGWPDDRPVWTGSCPCQPFSVAGQGAGTADERHLWPHWFHLVRALRPPTVFGEQVDAAINHGWLDLVQDDLEGEGYAFGAVGVPAAGVGAPHIRQRLWFVADSDHRGEHPLLRTQQDNPTQDLRGGEVVRLGGQVARGDQSKPSRLANNNKGLEGRGPVRQRGVELATREDGVAVELGDSAGTTGQRDTRAVSGAQAGVDGARSSVNGGGFVGPEYAGQGLPWSRADWLPCRDGKWRPVELAAREDGVAVELGNACGIGRQQFQDGFGRDGEGVESGWRQSVISGEAGGSAHWSRADWLPCRDGKWRPVEPGTFPLAHGVSNRVGRLRAYGNAIVPQVAEQVIRAYMECRP